MWKPLVGEPKENEIAVWSVSVGNLPLIKTKRVRMAIKIISEQDGFIGLCPCYPHGTLCLFDTENNAKGARNIMRYEGIECGDNICKVYIDKDSVK